MGTVNNPHNYSTTSGTTPTAQITDDVDYPHTGLIKSLSQGIRGNYAIKGSATDFDITFADGGSFTTIAVTAGKAYRDGKLETITALSATNMDTSYNSGTGAVDITPVTDNVYLMLVAKSDNTMVLRGSNAVTNRIPDYEPDDIPIAIIKVVGGSADDSAATSDRLVQFLTTDKVGNDLSIGYDDSGYTEALSVSANAGDTTIENKVSNKDIIFKVNDGGTPTEVARIDGEHARVGIGTDTPTTKLEVKGDTTISRSADSGKTRTLSIEGARNATGTDYARIDLENYDSHGPTSYVGARISAVNEADGVNDGSLVFSTNNANAGITERMRINDAGNVGIGTDSPETTLHLKSSSTLQPRLLIENTNTNVEEPMLIFRKNSATPNALTNPASFTDATCDTNHTTGLSDGASTSVRHITHNANANIVVGLTVSGTGIPSGATIVAINNSTCFTLSADTTATNTNTTLTFVSAEVDDLGIIRFEGEDSVGSNTLYAHILAESRGVTNTQEAGKLNFNVMHQGTSRRLLLVQGNTTAGASVMVNDGQQDCDFVVEGVGNAHLLRTDAANDRVAIGHNSPTATLDMLTGGTFRNTRLLTVSVSASTTLTEAANAGRYNICAGNVTLPSTSTAGEHYAILNTTGGDITIGRNGNNINGAGSDATLGTFKAATCIAIGSNNWMVIGV